MEQDPPLGLRNDELPTYDELAARQGPNSRFGRWKGWIEKRAAERYAEDTPEKRQARRIKGWGPHVDTQLPERTMSPSPSSVSPQTPPKGTLSRTQTVLSNPTPVEGVHPSEPLTSYITVGQALPPSHLYLHSFGSRFLPHSELPILSLLPLFDDTKLLIGHMNGLSVLDMDPETSSLELGSKEPRRRDIWHGEGIYQLALLEHEQSSTMATPEGVILALVGAEPPEVGSDKESKEPHKSIRMYNLASIASITRWATGRNEHVPLDLSRRSHQQPQHPVQTKKQKTGLSMARGLKLSTTDGSNDVSPRNIQKMHSLSSVPPTPPPKDPPKSSSPQSPPASLRLKVKRKVPPREESVEAEWGVAGHDDPGVCLYPSIPPPPPPKDPPKTSSATMRVSDKDQLHDSQDSTRSEWDLVGHDDLPLRWATDYVPLASPGSRLANQSVTFFELHRVKDGGRVTARLAIATKQNILLYESVTGERAFRFVKEFYTPIPARGARFVYQSQHDSLSKVHSAFSGSSFNTVPFSSSHWQGASDPGSTARRASLPGPLTAWTRSSFNSPRLCLFVVFEKKAGLIRVSDSSVGEVDLWEESGPSPSSGGSFRRSITSFENLALTKDWKGTWAPPAEIMLPLPQSTEFVTVYLLTRGKHTHIVPSPLPMPLASHAPLQVLAWGMHPSDVVPRVCERPETGEPFLQVTALSEDGVEVQELPLTFLALSSGKGKRREGSIVVVQAEVGPGGAGFLCMGGHWTERDMALQRHVSASTVDTAAYVVKRAREQGFYAWTQKGYDDWRVFWLGGNSHDPAPPLSP